MNAVLLFVDPRWAKDPAIALRCGPPAADLDRRVPQPPRRPGDGGKDPVRAAGWNEAGCAPSVGAAWVERDQDGWSAVQ